MLVIKFLFSEIYIKYELSNGSKILKGLVVQRILHRLYCQLSSYNFCIKIIMYVFVLYLDYIMELLFDFPGKKEEVISLKKSFVY
jgi:hypothetical protein